MAYLATIAPFGFADFNPPTLLPVYRQLGCVRSQFYRNPANPPRLAEARRIAEDAGLPFDSIHGVFGPEHDPSSPVEAIRRQAIETYRLEGEVALELGGPMVVVHPAPPLPRDVLETPQQREARYPPLLKSMHELALLGEELEVVYLIENIPATYCCGDEPARLARMVREIAHPNLAMCVDTGHAHMTTGAVAALRDCAQVIRYLHINDNNALQDSHHIPGDGTIPWEDVQPAIANLPPDTPAMLELFWPEQTMAQRVAAGLGEQLQAWLALR